MSTKTRIALYVTGTVFAVLAVAAIALPGSIAGLAIVAAMVVGVGLLAATNGDRPLSQLTAYDR